MVTKNQKTQIKKNNKMKITKTELEDYITLLAKQIDMENLYKVLIENRMEVLPKLTQMIVCDLFAVNYTPDKEMYEYAINKVREYMVELRKNGYVKFDNG